MFNPCHLGYSLTSCSNFNGSFSASIHITIRLKKDVFKLFEVWRLFSVTNVSCGYVGTGVKWSTIVKRCKGVNERGKEGKEERTRERERRRESEV